jgi:hypothetical protein
LFFAPKGIDDTVEMLDIDQPIAVVSVRERIVIRIGMLFESRRDITCDPNIERSSIVGENIDVHISVNRR